MATSDVIASLMPFFFLLSVPGLSFPFTWRSIMSAVQATSLKHTAIHTDENTSAIWSTKFNKLKYNNLVFASHITQSVSIRKTNGSMLCSEVIAVYCNH
jgi:hypothetical protein